MAKVYMVTDGWYSDYRVLGIYSTKAKAEKAKVLFNADNDIDSIDLDVVPKTPRGMLKWVVEMDRNGNVKDVSRENCDYPMDRASVWKPFDSDVTYLRAALWAKDEEHAVKIANEWRTRIVANNLWINGRYLEPGKDF